MKLATIGSLSDGFVNGLSEAGYFTDVDEPTIAEEEEDPEKTLLEEIKKASEEGLGTAGSPVATMFWTAMRKSKPIQGGKNATNGRHIMLHVVSRPET